MFSFFTSTFTFGALMHTLGPEENKESKVIDLGSASGDRSMNPKIQTIHLVDSDQDMNIKNMSESDKELELVATDEKHINFHHSE